MNWTGDLNVGFYLCFEGLTDISVSDRGAKT